MFAATQQIASVAGLRATKVQVRTNCFSLLPFAFDRRCAEYDAKKKTSSREPVVVKESDIFDRLFARYIRAFPSAIRIWFAQLTIKRSIDGTY
jgi:hypothetical protein